MAFTAGIIALWKDDTEGLYQLTEGAIYTSLVTHSLKWAINTDRPDNRDKIHFHRATHHQLHKGLHFYNFATVGNMAY